MTIRPALPADFDAMWPIFQAVVSAGTTYFFVPDTTPEEAFAYWFGTGIQSFVAEDAGVPGFGIRDSGFAIRLVISDCSSARFA